MAENGRSILWMSCPENPEGVFETRIFLQLPLIPDVRISIEAVTNFPMENENKS
jgi:hypothetical protein